jgi:hypothetical protein
MSLINYLKRVYYWYFNREVILESLRKRKGKCKQCGKGCYIFGIRCPFLTKENKCRIHNSKFRPFLLCQITPLNITKEDREVNKKFNCGYYWEDEALTKK